MPQQGQITFTIANGVALSDKVDIPQSFRPIAVVIPAAWTTANLTFLVSHDGGTTYNNFYDEGGTEITVVVGGTDRFIALLPRLWAGVSRLQIRSGTTGTPVNQGGARSVIVLGRPY